MTLRRFPALLALVLGVLCSPASQAHKASDALLTLARDQQPPVLRVDIALRDLQQVVGLDGDGDGAITWGEVARHRPGIESYLRQRLDVLSNGETCRFENARTALTEHSDGPYRVVAYDVVCPDDAPITAIDYNLLFESDPLHRGLLAISGRESGTLVFSPENRSRELTTSHWTTLRDYLVRGAWHIWLGFDHLLFLLVLLLPGALASTRSHARAVLEIVRVVTAFTVAHTLTLVLAALGLLQMPSRPVEAAIALSIVLTAALNLHPRLRHYGARLAFGFGLVHGIGFASVLQGLSLGGVTQLVALLGFNLGVEVGQIAIIAVLLPPLLQLRGYPRASRTVLLAGSAAAAALALVWFVGRLH